MKKVLAHPKDYIDIRNKGTKFVRENHSDINRVNAYQKIFDQLLPGGHGALLR